MVVVLVLGILLAIAVPTFLGARSSANHAATQSDLTDALITEHSIMAVNLAYSGDTSANGLLQTTELNLAWKPYNPTGAEASGNSVYVATDQTVNGTDGLNMVLSAVSSDGTCYFIADDNGTTAYASITAPGTPPVCDDRTPGLKWYDNFRDAASGINQIAAPNPLVT
jgi:type IV pilus assembly protein PilA